MRKTHPGLRPAIAAAILMSAPSTLPAASPSSQPSAFLRANAESTVGWMAWGDAAFTRAKREQKPVFLAIGSFSNELSRAMVRQSFANPDNAALLRDQFVCILVDAKERPDVAALYGSYVQTVKQLSGQPLNIWLTPELKPIDGATYLPPTEEWGKEGFSTALKRVASAWKTDAKAQRRRADEAAATVIGAEQLPAPPPLSGADIDRILGTATGSWRSRFDSKYGGFGDPPKYAEPELMRFFLRDPATRDMALETLRSIINGAVRDPLDGGFFRNSQSADWRLPYFQKTMADQARLALALLDAAAVSGDVRFATAARAALAYALDHLAGPGHDFIAAEDATTEELTATYFWTYAEIRDAVGEDDAPEFCRVYGVTEAGNIPTDALPGIATAGKNLLYRAAPLANEKTFAMARAKLLLRRQQRPAPRRDDSATSGAHGLMLAALARAGLQLSEPRFIAAAKTEITFIREHLISPDGSLRRLADRPAVAAPEDYALVADGLLTFRDTRGDATAESLARSLIDTATANYWDDVAGRYFAMRAPPETGFWARVHAPASAAGDLPSANAAMLLAIADHRGMDDAFAKIGTQLVRSIAGDIKDADDGSRGDMLLALQAARFRRP